MNIEEDWKAIVCAFVAVFLFMLALPWVMEGIDRYFCFVHHWFLK